ncbi:unnamed protein product [Peronospora farinosa]|uniref:Uncharacterized protein n=1 Tax=Peronospora farinosa TaxID=134698 RepID=A0AAV0SN78_9STRA|nr:unnamed protein product [Peronospora farinosa]CAI5704195.1 unnamed protein product [Peronospora farinosa]
MTTQRELNVRELLELERQIYQESIDRVLQQQEELNAGTLEEFVRRCRPFEADREWELQAAQHQFEFSQEDAQSLFEFDVQQAQDVFLSDRQQLKCKLLDRTRRERRRIERRLHEANFDTSNFRRSGRWSDNVEGVDKLQPTLLVKQLQRAQWRTRKSFNFRHLSRGVLPTPERIVEDVVEECAKLTRNREREETLKMGEEEGVEHNVKVVVSANGQELRCHILCGESEEEVDDTFRVGDAVVLISRLTEEDFYGFVSAITMEEIKLVLVCGTHVRVTIARLRSGQCVLRKQSEATLLPIEKREDAPFSEVATSLEKLLQDPPDARRHHLKQKTTIDNRRGF